MAHEMAQLILGVVVDHREEVLVAPFSYLFGHLFPQSGCRSVFARRVAEDESIIEADFIDEGSGGGIVLLGFAGESYNDIGSHGYGGAVATKFVDEDAKFFCSVPTVHRLEDSVRAGLEREVDVLGHLGEASEAIDQILAEADGVGGGEAEPFEAIYLVDGFE